MTKRKPKSYRVIRSTSVRIEGETWAHFPAGSIASAWPDTLTPEMVDELVKSGHWEPLPEPEPEEVDG